MPKPKIELLVNPYNRADGGESVLDVLVRELSSRSWNRFRAAVAFAQHTGNDLRLISAMKAFAANGNDIEITFGADTFANGGAGSEYRAVDFLLSQFGSPNVKFFLYREPKRTFHPKVYLFENKDRSRALAIVGSSNWSIGGQVNNVEANVVLRLAASSTDAHIYRQLCRFFDDYWQA